MAKSDYRVKEPVTYLDGKKVVMHTGPAAHAKIEDSVASKLGDRVQRLGGQDADSKPASVPQPSPPRQDSK